MGKPQIASSAIPTRYAGVQFRSRLEARWAAFFDQVGWKWTYEPTDLDTYIPDFILHMYRPVLVEVKPARTVEDLHALAAERIDISGWEGEALVVGELPVDGVDNRLGAFLERYDCGEPEPGGVDWDVAWMFTCALCSRVSFASESGWWACRACWGDDRHWRPFDPSSAWRQAGNLTQWRPPR